ncbi:hypothetical protein BX600DRAFT_436473 [Xylariales sp. PMI_506]|nr:hypothetical protein BX600DRAFT_436473 [Xylariales sp. PMI_506]
MSLKDTSAKAVEALNQAGLRDLVSPAGSDLYNERIADYWSLSAQLKPFCILHPKSTEQVVLVLETPLSVPGCQFAIRSGDHVAWGASNIDGGICVDLGVHLNSVSVSDDKAIVSIQPGARWRDVYKQLESTGIAVAGGRTGGVGVAGLLTGLTVNAEVVLADGRVINAKEKENSDLWRCLKGSSAGNFGIVTRLDVKAFPYDGLWAGMLVSEAFAERTADHITAMKNYIYNLKDCPDSSYIVLWNYEPTILRMLSSPVSLPIPKG